VASPTKKGDKMKKVFRVISILLLSLIVPLTVSAKPSEVQGKPVPTPAGKVVILDPGHGGTDSGAVYKDLKEKDVNLDIAKRTEALLENAGYTVYMTREDDSYKSNNDRYTFANAMQGNLLVSIHLNASTDHSIDYTKGFWGQKNKDLAFTKTIHNALVSGLGIQDGGVGQFASGVLIKSNMPATIAETVFLSSDYEYNLLTDGTGNRQQQTADSLYKGIVNYGL